MNNHHSEEHNQTPNEVFNLYSGAYPTLRDALFDAYPSLLVFDADTILTLLSDALPSYSGPLEQDAFSKWARAYCLTKALQFAQAVQILTSNDQVIRAAINRSLKSFAADCAIDEEDIYSEVSALVFRYADKLSRPGTAKLSSRLTALVRRHCWQTLKKRKNRLRLVEQYGSRLDIAGIEMLSPAEIAEISSRNDEMDCPYSRSETVK